MKYTLGIIIMLCLSLSAFAQDKIYVKTQKAPLEGRIIEMGINEVKYKPKDADYMVQVIEKQDIVKIVYESGRTENFSDPMEDFKYYTGQNKNIIKIGLLSPLFGFTDIYYERALKPGRSVEGQINIIGLGQNIRYNSLSSSYIDDNQRVDQKGVSLGIGMKFLRMPDYNTGRLRLRHILQGGYIKPVVNIGYYKRNFLDENLSTSSYVMKQKGVVAGNLGITLGKQWVYDNTLSLEIYGTLGIGFDNFRSVQKKLADDSGQNWITDDDIPYTNFGYTRFGKNDVGLTMGGGIKIGYLFHFKKDKEKEANAKK
jgi:hypothetical protein